MAPQRLSGLQKDVLSLYRKLLREALKKDRPNNVVASNNNNKNELSLTALLQGRSTKTTTSTTRYAAQEFRRQAASVKKTDFKRIEYMLRKGEKHVKLVAMPGVKVVGGSNKNMNGNNPNG